MAAQDRVPSGEGKGEEEKQVIDTLKQGTSEEEEDDEFEMEDD